MRFNLSKSALLISSALLTGAVAAQTNINFVEQAAKANISKQNLHLAKSQSGTVFTKGSFDQQLAAQTVNWNNGNIKNIQLNKSGNLKAQYIDSINQYFQAVAPQHGVNLKTNGSNSADKIHDTGRGGIIGQFTQKIDGKEVFGRSVSVLINRDNALVASTGYFNKAKQGAQSAFNLGADKALEIAFFNNTAQQLNDSVSLNQKNSSQYKQLNTKAGSRDYILANNSRVKEVYFPLSNDSLVSAYYVEAVTQKKGSKTSDWFSYVIDATSGKVLFKNNLSAHVATTYKVFADSVNGNIPSDGPHGNDFTPHPTGDIADTPAVDSQVDTQISVTLDHGPISTMDPWLTETETTTAGNNVDAYADISGEDGFDAEDVRPEMSGANAFEYDHGRYNDGVSGDGQKHAVVNLFYVNNFLHDWFYDNGFDEVAGNAQNNNFNRGGQGSDRLNVEAQDFGGVNNANMSTPADGSSPRMQMYVWTGDSDSSVTVTGVSNIVSLPAAFGPSDFDLTATLAMIDDGTDPVGDGCETITTDLTDKIAIIDRGDCNFTLKVSNAQAQGAVGVLMVNNVAGDPITMGGEDDGSITIPSMMVSMSQGQEIKDALALDSALEARLLNVSKPLDGTLDNGIVAHEWGHYITNRLVGNANGLSNNQGRSMGEGWGDFVALLMAVKEDDNLVAGNDMYQGVYAASTYVANAYYGIRRVPYSTDMSKNALTFKHIENGVALPDTHPVSYGQAGTNNSEVHNSGEVWAVALWDVFIALVNKPGYTFEQGREAMKDYLVAGLKMTPNAPTMTEARDAFLAAALAASTEDFELARTAFSRRGMGAGAVSPDRNSDTHAGVVEDFTPGVSLSNQLVVDESSFDNASCDNDGILDAGETATFNLELKSFSAEALPTVNVSLSSADDVTFASSTLSFSELSGFGDTEAQSFEITLNSASLMQTISVDAEVQQVGANPDDYIEPLGVSASTVGNFDFAQTAYSDDMSVATASNFDWEQDATSGITPFEVVSSVWRGVDSGAPGTSDLVTPELKVAATGDFVVSFNHFYLFEASEDNNGVFVNWDAGVIEVSVDGGEWTDVVTYGATLLEPYNGTVTDTTESLAGRAAYVYTRNPDSYTIEANSVTFPDGLVNGHNVKLRFRIGTDANTGDYGWLIDDVVVTNAIAPMFSSIVAEDNVCLSSNAPVVDAGNDITIRLTADETIAQTFSATASDADGDSLSYEWTQRAGPTVTLNNATSLNADFSLATPAEATTLVFELSVSDGSQTSTDIVQVNLVENSAPTVTATGSNVTEGATANLSASGSDADGDSLTYAWSQVSGPTVSLANADTANASFTAPDVNATTNLVFEVVVNDGMASSTAASATVVVNDTPASRSGGGSLPAWLLALSGLFLVRRKKQ
jgi:large repetitive protein